MKIQLILETLEECHALRRYIKYCLDETAEFNMFVFKNLYGKYSHSFIEQDLTITFSPNEIEESGEKILDDFGLQIAISFLKTDKKVLLLYSKQNGELTLLGLFALKTPWQNVNLSEQLRQILSLSSMPGQAVIEEVRKICPPRVKGHGHHGGHHG